MESELIGKHVVGQELPAIAHELGVGALKDEVAICGVVPVAALHGAGAPEMPKRLLSTLASEIAPWPGHSAKEGGVRQLEAAADWAVELAAVTVIGAPAEVLQLAEAVADASAE